MTLKETRFYMGLSQWALSIKTNIPQSKISLFENGYLLPSDEEKQRIASVFGKKPSELFPVDRKNHGHS